MKVGVREIKNHFSEYLRRVKQGEIVYITERNVPVAKLTPIKENVDVEILNLVEQGIASWEGGKPEGLDEPPEVRGFAYVSSLVAEDRR